jgi:hypothetical protein
MACRFTLGEILDVVKPRRPSCDACLKTAGWSRFRLARSLISDCDPAAECAAGSRRHGAM